MIYKILNYFLDKRIDELRPIVKNLLNQDLKEQGETCKKIISKDMISTLVHSEGTKRTEEYMEVISRRLEMERKYILLIDQFKNDYKRQFMIRKNFYAYLKAIKFLYSMNGTSTAPSSIYHIISEAESCFNQLNYFQPKK